MYLHIVFLKCLVKLGIGIIQNRIFVFYYLLAAASGVYFHSYIFTKERNIVPEKFCTIWYCEWLLIAFLRASMSGQFCVCVVFLCSLQCSMDRRSPCTRMPLILAVGNIETFTTSLECYRYALKPFNLVV